MSSDEEVYPEDYYSGHGRGYDAAVEDMKEFMRDLADDMYGAKQITSKQMLGITALLCAVESEFK